MGLILFVLHNESEFNDTTIANFLHSFPARAEIEIGDGVIYNFCTFPTWRWDQGDVSLLTTIQGCKCGYPAGLEFFVTVTKP